jgi:quercetin dioxygenase-like cupin family protein
MLGAAPFSATIAESAAALKRVRIASIDLSRSQDVARVTLVELDYRPGEKVGMHLHPVPVLGYVQSGAFVVQLKDEPPRVYRKGEVVYEPPTLSCSATTTLLRLSPPCSLRRIWPAKVRPS